MFVTKRFGIKSYAITKKNYLQSPLLSGEIAKKKKCWVPPTPLGHLSVKYTFVLRAKVIDMVAQVKNEMEKALLQYEIIKEAVSDIYEIYSTSNNRRNLEQLNLLTLFLQYLMW